MSTGHTSASFRARSASRATASSTSTSMKIALAVAAWLMRPHSCWNLRSEPLLHEVGDLGDLLRDRDAGLLEARDLLGGRVRLALDDRAGVAEAHARHLVHELAGHERHDRQPRVVLGDPAG